MGALDVEMDSINWLIGCGKGIEYINIGSNTVNYRHFN
jgi:hypothetical protein